MAKGGNGVAALAVLPRLRASLCVCVATCVCLIAPGGAEASAPSFTWSGQAPVVDENWALAEQWSQADNWEAATAPAASESVGVLSFPHLANTPCVNETGTEACYFSSNDVSDLSAEALHLDDGDDYFLEGDELNLGVGGLQAAPAAESSGAAGAFVFTPLHLTADQKWIVADRVGGELEENGVLLEEPITGEGKALTIEQSNASALILDNKTEVGPVTLQGVKPEGERIANGATILEGELDAANAEPVKLSHIFLAGNGAVGALHSEASTISVGSESYPAEGLEVDSASLDSTTGVVLEVTGAGTTARTDYSQLTSKGAIDLGGTMVVYVHPPGKNAACPTLKSGSAYTFVSTAGTLSGVFANAPGSGTEIPIDYNESACGQPRQKMRIEYSASAVTGTVIGGQAGSGGESGSTASEAARQANTSPPPMPILPPPQTAVLAAKEAAPAARLASTALTATRSGAVVVKVLCPAGPAPCTGALTMTTAGAVSAAGHRPSVLALGRSSFSVRAGSVKTVALHLSAKARALLALKHRLRVRVTVNVRTSTGATHTWQTVTTLHASKGAGR